MDIPIIFSSTDIFQSDLKEWLLSPSKSDKINMFTNNSIAANLAGLVKNLSTIIKKKKGTKDICNPESFNTYISPQLFDYTITFVNSQHWNTNSKGDFVLKNRIETFVLKISGIQN